MSSACIFIFMQIKVIFIRILALEAQGNIALAQLVLNKQGTGYEYPSPQLVASNMADKTGKTKYGSAFAWKVVKSPHFSVIQGIFD